jgi:hypothetical protein
MPIQSSVPPVCVPAADWQNPGVALRGLLEGKTSELASRSSAT